MMLGRKEAFERWNPKRRGPHENQVHGHSPLDGLPLEPLPLAFDEIALDLAHPLPDQHAIQMIDLMLKRPRE
jgi:hypothetical protein